MRTDPREALEAYRDVGLATWNAARDALVAIDALLGIEVEPLKLDEEPLHRNVSRSGAFELRLPDGSIRNLPEHAIARDVLKARDRSAARVAARVVGEDDRLNFPATLTRVGERALSIALVSDSLAQCAFGEGREPLTAAAPAEAPGDVDAARADQPRDDGGGENLAPPGAPGGSAETTEDAPDETPESAPEAAQPQPGSGGAGVPPDEGGDVAAEKSGKPRKGGDGADDRASLADIRRVQRSAWEKRAPRSPRMRRIALLQWDVADSYYFPSDETDRDFRWEDPDGKKKRCSLEEMRRRAILERVIEACEAFQVEGLVIPEYTMRPETVNWLYDHLKLRDEAEIDFPMAIWAGTFRVPSDRCYDVMVDENGSKKKAQDWQLLTVADPGTTPAVGIDRIEPFSSVLPLIYRIPPPSVGHSLWPKVATPAHEGAWPLGFRYRLKRHPAVAFQEFFRPDRGTSWEPLGAPFRDHAYLLSFTMELICAEMFLHASTANLLELASVLAKLEERLGIGGTLGEIEDILKEEILTFAKLCGFSVRASAFSHRLGQSDTALQRSLLIIPAMTSRSADYHIFGQTQHLAAGLVTVFANPSSKDGCGGSAFIGLDAWKTIDQKVTPYGEIGPGLFHYQKADFGALRERECALVIADVDPLHTTDQKPRPQYQPRPLQLVAHLPLIFETEACNEARYTKKTPGGDEKKETPPLRHENDGIAAGRRSPRDHPDGKRVVRRRDLPWDHAPGDGSTKEKPTVDEKQVAHTFSEAIAATWNAARKAAAAGRYRDRALDSCLRVLTRFADDPDWLDKRREQLTKTPIAHPPGDPPPALVDWIYVEDGFDRVTPSAVSDDPEPRGQVI